jgi:hypothetical protein
MTRCCMQKTLTLMLLFEISVLPYRIKTLSFSLA